MMRLIRKFLLATGILLASQVAMAQPPIYFENDDGIALDGYDPVAYFVVQEPTKGDAAISAQYDGATYHFSSTANRDAFLAQPAAYAPQYGGYCAYAASLGKKAPGDPKQWTVRDGKLYVNYNARVQKQWSAAPDKFIQRADGLWESIKND